MAAQDGTITAAYDPPCSLRERSLRRLDELGLDHVLAAESPHLSGVQSAVRNGLGYALLAAGGDGLRPVARGPLAETIPAPLWLMSTPPTSPSPPRCAPPCGGPRCAVACPRRPRRASAPAAGARPASRAAAASGAAGAPTPAAPRAETAHRAAAAPPGAGPDEQEQRRGALVAASTA